MVGWIGYESTVSWVSYWHDKSLNNHKAGVGLRITKNSATMRVPRRDVLAMWSGVRRKTEALAILYSSYIQFNTIQYSLLHQKKKKI